MGEKARLAVLLPVRELLSKRKSGAVALSLADFTAFSRFRDETVILGAHPCDLAALPFRQLVGWRRWHLRDRVAYARAAASFAKDQKIALIEVQNRPTILTMLRKSLPNAKLALFLHNDPQEMEGTRTSRERARILAEAGAVYCNSEFVRGRFLDGLAADGGKVHVVPYGLDIAKLPVLPKERIVAFAGRIVREKGIVELIKGFALAAPRLVGWRLVVAGEDRSGLLSGAELKADIAALGERLTLIGHVDHAGATALFARAEIAATPAIWREPFGRTTLEAMAAGCAIVSSGSGGSGEVLGDCGLIVESVTPTAIAAALITLAGDDARRRELQDRARRRAALFDIRAASARLDALRQELLAD